MEIPNITVFDNHYQEMIKQRELKDKIYYETETRISILERIFSSLPLLLHFLLLFMFLNPTIFIGGKGGGMFTLGGNAKEFGPLQPGEITLKDVAGMHETKEEIFLAIFKREYDCLTDDLLKIIKNNDSKNEINEENKGSKNIVELMSNKSFTSLNMSKEYDELIQKELNKYLEITKEFESEPKIKNIIDQMTYFLSSLKKESYVPLYLTNFGKITISDNFTPFFDYSV